MKTVADFVLHKTNPVTASANRCRLTADQFRREYFNLHYQLPTADSPQHNMPLMWQANAVWSITNFLLRLHSVERPFQKSFFQPWLREIVEKYPFGYESYPTDVDGYNSLKLGVFGLTVLDLNDVGLSCHMKGSVTLLDALCPAKYSPTLVVESTGLCYEICPNHRSQDSAQLLKAFARHSR